MQFLSFFQVVTIRNWTLGFSSYPLMNWWGKVVGFYIVPLWSQNKIKGVFLALDYIYSKLQGTKLYTLLCDNLCSCVGLNPTQQYPAVLFTLALKRQGKIIVYFQYVVTSKLLWPTIDISKVAYFIGMKISRIA